MISRRYAIFLLLALLTLFMSMPLPESTLSFQAGSDNNFIAASEIPDIDVNQDGSEKYHPEMDHANQGLAPGHQSVFYPFRGKSTLLLSIKTVKAPPEADLPRP